MEAAHISQQESPSAREANRLVRRRRRSPAARLERALTRSASSVLAIAALAGLLLSLAWQNGGFYPPAYLRTGGVAFAIVAGLLLVRPPQYRIAPAAMVAVGSLLAYAGWTWVSTHWSPSPPTGLEDAQRSLAYAGILALGVLASGSGRLARFAVWTALTVAMTVVVAALVSRLYPAGSPIPLAIDPSSYRLAYPFGYWNALGAFAGMAALLSGGLAASRRQPLALRGLASAASFVAIVTMYFTLSRGAWLAVAGGLVVLLLVSPRRGSLLLTILVVGLAATIAILRLHAYPALVDNPYAGHGEAAAGRAFLPLLILLAVACAGAQAGLAYAERHVQAQFSFRLAGRTLSGSAVVALTCAVLALGYISTAAAGGPATNSLHKLEHFVSKQWHDFNRPAGQPAVGTARLTSAKTTRGDLYRVGLDQFKAHPLAGAGAGGYQSAWYRHRRYGDSVQNAHSLYIETLAELGLVGALLLAGFVGSGLWAGVRSRRRPTALGQGETAAVLAATTVWLVHAGVDWDWQMQAFTGVLLLLLATLFPVAQRQRSDRPPRRRQIITGALAAASVVAAIYMWQSSTQARHLVDASRLGAAGYYTASLREARQVTMAPASDRALLTEAYDLEDLGRLREADRAFGRAAAADPSNWFIRRDWALELQRGGRLRRARAEMRRAVSLNPKLLTP